MPVALIKKWGNQSYMPWPTEFVFKVWVLNSSSSFLEVQKMHLYDNVKRIRLFLTFSVNILKTYSKGILIEAE